MKLSKIQAVSLISTIIFIFGCQPSNNQERLGTFGSQPGSTNIESIAYGAADDEPVECPENYNPVCGIDGITYPNNCLLEAEGVELDYEGACIEGDDTSEKDDTDNTKDDETDIEPEGNDDDEVTPESDDPSQSENPSQNS